MIVQQAPSKHLELSTRQGYRSNLDRHFLPYFGHWSMAKILPSVVQGWVTKAVSGGLSATSVRKYHTMLHSIGLRTAWEAPARRRKEAGCQF